MEGRADDWRPRGSRNIRRLPSRMVMPSRRFTCLSPMRGWFPKIPSETHILNRLRSCAVFQSRLLQLLGRETVNGYAQKGFSPLLRRAFRLSTSAFAQDTAHSAKDIRGASPYISVENEPAPKLIVDPPVREALAQGVFWARYRWSAVSRRCSASAPSQSLRGSVTCTSLSMICLGGGLMQATITPSTLLGCRPESTK